MFYLILKLITFVVSSCLLIMVLPISQTKPTELMMTSWTSHVITALIFLDRFSTFWIRARFCVSNHPCYVIRLVPVLEIPFCSQLAVTRPMRNFATFEAKSQSTLTSYIFNGKISSLYAVSTTGSRAPFDAFVVVCERLTVEFKVGLLGLKTLKYFLPNRMRNFHGAFLLKGNRIKDRCRP